MAKRIILISSFPLLVAIAIIAIVLAGIGHGQPAVTPAEIEQSKSQIISLIQSGKLTEADAATDKIMSLPMSKDKGKAIQETGTAYQIANQYNKAIQLCDYVLQNWPKEDFAVWAGVSMAFAQAGKGNTAAVDSAVERIIADCADSPELPRALLVMAEHYSWQKTFDKAERLYNIVIAKSPNSDLSAKARLGSTCANALTLIENQQYSPAQKQADLMAADFNSQAELPGMLHHIGKEFYWKHQFTEAKNTLDLVKNLPNNSFTQSAKLWSANAGVCELIKQDDDNGAIAAIDKLIADFEGNAELPEVVYRISKEYEWKKGTKGSSSPGWYDTPNSVYQKLMQQFGDTTFGQEAQSDQKRLTHRMKIFNLLKTGDQNQIDTAIETMAADLKGKPELSGEFYWLACGYEEQDKREQSKQMYERIVRECPGSEEADRAAMDIQRRIICDFFDSGDIDSSTIALDKFISDFKQRPGAGDCLGRAEIGFYNKATELRVQNNKMDSMKYAAKAADVWEKIKSNNLNISTDLVYLYYYAGANYLLLERWDDAIIHLQNILDNWPDFPYACVCQDAIAGSYEVLRDTGKMPKEGTNPLIEEAYKAILEKYPDCYANKEAAFKLGGLMQEKGDKTGAIYYYRKFLELCQAGYLKKSMCGISKSQVQMLETAKAKLAELTSEGGSN